MMTAAKVLADLKIQREHEGSSADIALVEWALSVCQTSSELSALTTCSFKRYGKMSYECHRFWHPSNVLRAMSAGCGRLSFWTVMATKSYGPCVIFPYEDSADESHYRSHAQALAAAKKWMDSSGYKFTKDGDTWEGIQGPADPFVRVHIQRTDL